MEQTRKQRDGRELPILPEGLHHLHTSAPGPIRPNYGFLVKGGNSHLASEFLCQGVAGELKAWKGVPPRPSSLQRR